MPPFRFQENLSSACKSVSKLTRCQRSRSRGSKVIEIANGVEAVQDGRIHIETVNGSLLFEVKGTPVQYLAGNKHAIERGWIVLHESGTYLKFTQADADLFA